MSILRPLLLNLYYHGSYPYRRWVNRRAAAEGRAPAVVLCYHRIADDAANDWTMSNRMFVRQIQWLQARFDLISLEEVQRRLAGGKNRRPCVSITFDDGYADNCHQAIPLLIKQRIPCTYFVTARNILDRQPFAHDLARKQSIAPNTLDQLRAMVGAGIQIGAHCYNHVDLGQITHSRRLYDEVVISAQVLRRALDQPIRYFAFPYGKHDNLNSEAFALAKQAGYEAVCSAYGGYNFPGDDVFHLQRIPLDNLMLRLKNRVTIDPRRRNTPRFEYTAALEQGRTSLEEYTRADVEAPCAGAP